MRKFMISNSTKVKKALNPIKNAFIKKILFIS